MKKTALFSVVAAALLVSACTTEIGEGNVPVKGKQFEVSEYQKTLDKTYALERADLHRQDGKVYNETQAQADAAQRVSTATPKAAASSNAPRYSSANLQ